MVVDWLSLDWWFVFYGCPVLTPTVPSTFVLPGLLATVWSPKLARNLPRWSASLGQLWSGNRLSS